MNGWIEMKVHGHDKREGERLVMLSRHGMAEKLTFSGRLLFAVCWVRRKKRVLILSEVRCAVSAVQMFFFLSTSGHDRVREPTFNLRRSWLVLSKGGSDFFFL